MVTKVVSIESHPIFFIYLFVLMFAYLCNSSVYHHQSRLSPFANTRKKKERRDIGGLFEGKGTSKINTSKSINLKKWFSVIDAASLSKKRALLPVEKLRTSLILNSKLHRTLYGFIVFEVAWSDVRGINYLNELQVTNQIAYAFFSHG